MKKFKITIVTEADEAWYNENATEMKREIETGEAQKELMTSRDKKEGMHSLTMTFEDITE